MPIGWSWHLPVIREITRLREAIQEKRYVQIYLSVYMNYYVSSSNWGCLLWFTMLWLHKYKQFVLYTNLFTINGNWALINNWLLFYSIKGKRWQTYLFLKCCTVRKEPSQKQWIVVARKMKMVCFLATNYTVQQLVSQLLMIKPSRFGSAQTPKQSQRLGPESQN